MSSRQRWVFTLLGLIGVAYFALFFYPNTKGLDPVTGKSVDDDEVVTYPNVIRMLTPGKSLNETRANLFLYEDYHYGYPFYAYSALVVLPSRLLYGSAFTQHPALNLFLLRQFVSLLPMILAAGVLVFIQTRFESVWKSVALFVFLLTIRGVMRNSVWWWHPDALTVLCIVMTFFFLVRDRMRFGRNFYLAAVACGLATAIKLSGVFFFLTIPGYVLAGWLQKHITLKKAALISALFILVMSATVIFSNPFLFSSQQRAQMIKIQTQKQDELGNGYTHDDPLYYRKGPEWWASTLEKWYASPVFLAFLFGSVLAGCIWGKNRLLNRLILSWIIPYSIYLLYFVAVKPDHYWLPVMLPLFSSAFTLMDLFSDAFSKVKRITWQKVALGLVVLALLGQFTLHLTREVSGNIPWYQSILAQIQTSQ